MSIDASKPEVIVALDVERRERALELVRTLRPRIRFYKVGSRLFTAEGPALIGEIVAMGASVFLDLKFHDIPATVEGSVRAATAIGVAMMTVHASGGVAMMETAARSAAEEAKRRSLARPRIVGVTVLTSLSASDLAGLFAPGRSVRDLVLALAARAREAGLDGVVASVEEASAIRESLGPGFTVVTPGIRPAGADAGDQKRIATPAAAARAGADFIVVGRPIIEAPSPREAAEAILGELRGDRS
jgi:orotidine-5'-phosphate decarboxylase